jgi:predicted RecA/RadA family phage recombinase
VGALRRIVRLEALRKANVVDAGAMGFVELMAGMTDYIASGTEGPINLTGIYDLPKTAAQAWTVGALIYWSGTACTNVAATNKLIGIAARAQLAADTIGRVRLNAAGITP